jgi:hypothetical protein
VKVLLLPGSYADVYDSEVLHLLDETWERYKPVLVQSKEMFLPLSQMAQAQALQYVLEVMRHNGVDTSKLTKNTTPDGKFEFKNVPQGEYKVVAHGEIAGGDVVWQGWLNLDAAGPVPVLLKSTLP